ncbi:MAG: DUF6314 family protein [Chitinophagales bacterium]
MEREVLKIFKNLEGDWLLFREINDVLKDKLEYAEGRATFRSGDDNLDMDERILDYEEFGILKLSKPEKSLKFKRNYVYKYQNEEIEIYLDDGPTKGKLFQKLLKRSNGEEYSFKGTEHICRLDKHNGNYYFKNDREFETYYTIEGKNKRIEIKTLYKKIKAAPNRVDERQTK